MASGDLDARTDIYSLGCVLFEMLAGEPPVASMTERRVHNWAALETSKALQGTHTGVARAVKHAISRALAPLPDDRFPTVTEFATALGGMAHRTSVPTRGVFASRRRRRFALALGVVLAVVGVGAAVRLLRDRGWHLNDRRVVVAVIENHTGDPTLDNVGHMAADWVSALRWAKHTQAIVSEYHHRSGSSIAKHDVEVVIAVNVDQVKKVWRRAGRECARRLKPVAVI